MRSKFGNPAVGHDDVIDGPTNLGIVPAAQEPIRARGGANSTLGGVLSMCSPWVKAGCGCCDGIFRASLVIVPLVMHVVGAAWEDGLTAGSDG